MLASAVISKGSPLVATALGAGFLAIGLLIVLAGWIWRGDRRDGQEAAFPEGSPDLFGLGWYERHPLVTILCGCLVAMVGALLAGSGVATLLGVGN